MKTKPHPPANLGLLVRFPSPRRESTRDQLLSAFDCLTSSSQLWLVKLAQAHVNFFRAVQGGAR
jgi:hypothetical protein